MKYEDKRKYEDIAASLFIFLILGSALMVPIVLLRFIFMGLC